MEQLIQQGTGMRAQSRDADLESESVQIDLLRKASLARRAALAFSLSETAVVPARNAIRLQFPDMSDRDVLPPTITGRIWRKEFADIYSGNRCE